MRRDVALIILYDAEKRILLQHRDKGIDFAPDYWAFFGGGIEPQETPEEALRREVYEELHHRIKNPELLIRQPYANFGRTGTKHVYTEQCLDKSSLELHEGQGWGWFKIFETSNLKMSDVDRNVLDYLRQKYNFD